MKLVAEKWLSRQFASGTDRMVKEKRRGQSWHDQAREKPQGVNRAQKVNSHSAKKGPQPKAGKERS